MQCSARHSFWGGSCVVIAAARPQSPTQPSLPWQSVRGTHTTFPTLVTPTVDLEAQSGMIKLTAGISKERDFSRGNQLLGLSINTEFHLYSLSLRLVHSGVLSKVLGAIVLLYALQSVDRSDKRTDSAI
jgi:hypothetical protein